MNGDVTLTIESEKEAVLLRLYHDCLPIKELVEEMFDLITEVLAAIDTSELQEAYIPGDNRWVGSLVKDDDRLICSSICKSPIGLSFKENSGQFA
jgi:hypothetical protein